MSASQQGAILASGLAGALIGAFTSWVVNCTLIEISLNAFFCVYFGVLFVFVGTFMLWRVSVNQSENQQVQSGFAGLVIVSGLFCFMLKKNWLFGLTALMKVPLYSVLGISVAATLAFSFVDLANYSMAFFRPQACRNIVEKKSQVYVIMLSTVTMGACFGFIFGWMNVEESQGAAVRFALLKEERYCYPIGLILGFLAGAANEYLRTIPGDYSKIGSHSAIDQFDDDI